MKGQEHLTRPEQFTKVYNGGGSFSDYFLVIKWLPNGLDFSRYGISASKRIGNAVTRNRVKRLIREVMRLNGLPPGWDVVWIARNSTAKATYFQLKKSMNHLLQSTKIMAGQQ